MEFDSNYPPGLKRVTEGDFQQITHSASEAARLRTNRNLHPDLGDPVQRFLNAIEPGSYVRPHRHTAPPRWELFVGLAGCAAVLIFDPEGRVLARESVGPSAPCRAVEIPAGAWHSIVALEPGTVLFEIKQGPYIPLDDKDFAPWAPAEGTIGAARMENWLRSAEAGDLAPS
jgi:cupin fold WbuC family metalloprotein